MRPTSTSGYSSTNRLVFISARPTEMQAGSKLSSAQCSKRFGMRAAASKRSVRASVLQRQGFTPLPSTSSHPVPPQLAHVASFMSANSEIIHSVLLIAREQLRGELWSPTARDYIKLHEKINH